MRAIGIALAFSGLVIILVGVVILTVAAVKLVKEAFAKPPQAGVEAPAINLPDVSKLMETLVKLPQWLLAILAGDLQVWLGTRLMSGLPWWPQ
jgi:hypothetical protein